ncbi:hypothetical protein vseg_020796 [Gypsophila vaccaria]
MDVIKMRNVMFLVVVLFTMNVVNGVVAVKEVKVGGRHGWSVPQGNDTQFYVNWASSRRVHVGDSLRFEYKNDSVLVVDKYGYYHCDTSKATSTYNDGNTSIKLDHPGFSYFISGTVNHCSAGQRLQINVMSSHGLHPAASPAEDHHHAEAPAPGVSPKSDGSMVQVSLFMGLVVVASMLFV